MLDVAEAEPKKEAAAPERRPLDKDADEGARAVILTILNKNPEPVDDAKLQRQSEFGAELYARTLGELAQRGLIVSSTAGHVLTPAGRQAAARERDRILSLW